MQKRPKRAQADLSKRHVRQKKRLARPLASFTSEELAQLAAAQRSMEEQEQQQQEHGRDEQHDEDQEQGA